MYPQELISCHSFWVVTLPIPFIFTLLPCLTAILSKLSSLFSFVPSRIEQRTISTLFSHVNVRDEEIAKHVKTSEHQSMLRKAFRNCSGTESEKKQEYIRVILCNAASTRIVSAVPNWPAPPAAHAPPRRAARRGRRRCRHRCWCDRARAAVSRGH